MSDIRDTPAHVLVSNKKKVIVVRPETTVAETLSIMDKAYITGVPVFSEETGWKGFISVLDVMAYIALFTYTKQDQEQQSPPTTLQTVSSALLHQEDLDNKFANLDRPVSDLLSLSSETASELWAAYGNEETLGTIAGRLSSGIHRLLISVDDEARLLTQTDVVTFLYENDKSPILSQTISELSLGLLVKVVSIKDTDTALHGFRVIYKEQVGAVPVLNSEGQLVSTLSASDVRSFKESDFSDLLLSVTQYLTKHNISRSPVHVNATTPLNAVIKTILDGRIHRVWITDDNMGLIGVVSLSDIIRLWYK